MSSYGTLKRAQDKPVQVPVSTKVRLRFSGSFNAEVHRFRCICVGTAGAVNGMHYVAFVRFKSV